MCNPWFRFYNEAIDDEKLRLLAFEDRWHFVAILCLKNSGVLDASDADDLLRRKVAVKLGVQLRELDDVERRLQAVGLIGDGFQPIAWHNRQFQSDTSKERTRKYRERMKRHGDVTVTAQDTDTDTDTDTDIKILSARARVSDDENGEVVTENAKPPKRRKFDASAMELPACIPLDAWAEFVQHRKDIRKPMTELSAGKAIKTLVGLAASGENVRSCIDRSIERGYTGIFGETKNDRRGDYDFFAGAVIPTFQ